MEGIQLSRIPWKEVESSQFKGIYYDAKSMILYMKFNRGQIWKYDYVDFNEYKLLMSSESIGKYFHANIKNNKLATKLSDGDKLKK